MKRNQTSEKPFSCLMQLQSDGKWSFILSEILLFWEKRTFDKIVFVLPNFNKEDCTMFETLPQDKIKIYDSYHPSISKHICNDRMNHKKNCNMFFVFHAVDKDVLQTDEMLQKLYMLPRTYNMYTWIMANPHVSIPNRLKECS